MNNDTDLKSKANSNLNLIKIEGEEKSTEMREREGGEGGRRGGGGGREEGIRYRDGGRKGEKQRDYWYNTI